MRRDPVSHRAAVTVIGDSEPDAPDDCGSDRHCKTLLVRCDLTSDERKRIRVRIWRRNRGDPPRHVRIVTTGDNCIDVVLRPRTKREIAVAKLHGEQSKNEAKPCAAATADAFRDPQVGNPRLAGFRPADKDWAASYSP